MARPSPEYVRSEIEKRGFVVLNDYQNCHTKIIIKCPNGHEVPVIFDTFRNTKGGCIACANEAKKTTDSEIVEIISPFGYKLLGKQIIRRSTNITIECPFRHQYRVQLSHFKNGHRCARCYHLLSRKPETKLVGWLRRLDEIAAWTKRQLEIADYTCFISSIRGGKLHVHHAESFSAVAKRAIEDVCGDKKIAISDVSPANLDLIKECFLEMHSKINGYPMASDLHILFHSLYGKRTTESQLLEFKDNYRNNRVSAGSGG